MRRTFRHIKQPLKQHLDCLGCSRRIRTSKFVEILYEDLIVTKTIHGYQPGDLVLDPVWEILRIKTILQTVRMGLQAIQSGFFSLAKEWNAHYDHRRMVYIIQSWLWYSCGCVDEWIGLIHDSRKAISPVVRGHIARNYSSFKEPM